MKHAIFILQQNSPIFNKTQPHMQLLLGFQNMYARA